MTPLRISYPTLAAAIMTAGLALNATAQDTKLDTVVVTASGFEQVIEDAPASITVITREELEKAPFRDLTDALKSVEGVVVTGTTNEKDIFIRGLPGAYTLILVDGKRQSTREARTNGNSGFEQSFVPPLDAIERIEVVRGPMSSLYGSDAMGGVINIITRKVPKKWGGSIGIDGTLQKGDSGNSHQEQFFVGGPVKEGVVGLQVWGRSYHRSEDEFLNGANGANDKDITARLAITPDARQDIRLEAGTTEVKRSSSPGKILAANGTSAYNKNPRDHYALSHAGRWSWGNSDFSISQEKAKRETYSLDKKSGDYVKGARAPEITNTILDAKFTVPVGNHLIVTGGQWNKAELEDVNPGLRDNIVRKYSITQKALFIEDEWSLTESVALTGGLRLDDHPIYGKHWSPRLYSVWHSTNELTFKGGVSRGFRAPDIRSITPGYAYTTGGSGCVYGPNGTCGVIIADPSLHAETSTSYELAALWNNRKDLSLSATVFYTDFKDKVSNAVAVDNNGNYIRWPVDNNYRVWYNYNVDNAKIKGVELSANWKPSVYLTINGNYTYTHSKQKGGAFDGYALARTPKHKAYVRGDWSVGKGVTLWAAANYHGKEINAAARSGSNGALIAQNVRQYGSYSLYDIGASYEMNAMTTLNFGIYNVNDKKLDEATYNTVGDRRRLWVSANFKF